MTLSVENGRRLDPISTTLYKETIVVMVAWAEAAAELAVTRCRACGDDDAG